MKEFLFYKLYKELDPLSNLKQKKYECEILEGYFSKNIEKKKQMEEIFLAVLLILKKK